jgi:hypothetical protein
MLFYAFLNVAERIRRVEEEKERRTGEASSCSPSMWRRVSRPLPKLFVVILIHNLVSIFCSFIKDLDEIVSL